MDPSMLNNPDMMSKMAEMQKDPAFMAQVQEMMKNPEMMQNMMNMMGGMGGMGDMGGMPDLSGMGGEPPENPENLYLKYKIGSSVSLVNLKSETYNGKSGLIQSYNSKKQRYVINLNDMDKFISVREDNIELEENDSSNEGEVVEKSTCKHDCCDSNVESNVESNHKEGSIDSTTIEDDINSIKIE